MAKRPQFEVLEMTPAEREAFLERVRPGQTVSAEDHRLIEGLVRGTSEVLALMERRDMSLRRLRRLVFGARTEKTSTVCAPPDDASQASPPPAPAPTPTPRPKRLGHGRHPASAYTGARRVAVPHPHLHPGDRCPECRDGKLHRLAHPSIVLRLVGQAPIEATAFEQERLRCATCGKVFTAPPPPEAGSSKYDESVAVSVVNFRYGSGFPFYRLARLQHSAGVPLPEATQWEQSRQLAQVVVPAVQCLIHQAAQRPVLHNDDTDMRVASLRREPAAPLDADAELESSDTPTRTGIFTTGIVADGGQPPIALFFTGHRHAGENLREVLRQRDAQLPPPIRMCDGLSRNDPKESPTVPAACLAHGRRQIVDVAEAFPQQARHVLERVGEVYHHDAEAREQKLSPEERLRLHQQRSKPILDELHRWLREQCDQKLVEPNSALGKAIDYLLRRWEPLTLFLREPGAPLDNNLCERALKMAILHRKNSLSYKTQNGAQVGDTFMSLIHTCRLNLVNPFDYLLALARHPRQLAEHPERWLPWNYRDTLAADTS